MSSTVTDRVPRLLTYRAIPDYPLLIAVGVSTDDIFAKIEAKRRAYYAVATTLTVLILIVVMASVRQRIAQQRISENLRLQNIRFDIALRNMGQGLCVFDAEKKLAVCNERYATMYQLPPELQRAGTPHTEIIAHRIAHGILKGESDADAVQRKLLALAQLPAAARSVRVDELANGHLISITREPIEGGGWVATHEDITERKRAEWELDRARRFLDTVIENVPMPIVVKDPETRKFLLVNRAYETFIGMPRENLIGVTAHDLFPADQADLIDRFDSEALNLGERKVTAELELDSAETGSRICTTTRLVVRDERDRPQYLIVVIEDVTERKKTEVADRPHGAPRPADRPAQPHALCRAPRAGADAGSARGAGRGAAARPRPFQAHQRHGRAPDRRQRAQDRCGAPAQLRPGDRYGRAPQRRRIRDHPDRRGEADRRLGPGGADPEGDQAAVRSCRPACRRQCEHRHLARSGRCGRPDRADEEGGPRPLQGQDRRARHLLLLRIGDGRAREGAAQAGSRSAQCARRRRVRIALSAGRERARQRGRRPGGAAALAPSRTRVDLPRRVRCGRRRRPA